MTANKTVERVVLEAQLEVLTAENKKLKEAFDDRVRVIEMQLADKDELVEAYELAINDIEDWAAYAGDFFRDKHDIRACLLNHRELLAKHQSVKGNDNET